MMDEPLIVTKNRGIWILRINREVNSNSINYLLLKSINQTLDQAEADDECRILVLAGTGDYFCTGMDFEETMSETGQHIVGSGDDDDYMSILKRFASTSKVVVSKVEGSVVAGGIGFVAASDLVISHHDSQFSLSEALWGLLPACVTPFLIRRVGFQHAYKMTLSTSVIDAEEAYRIGLVDILSDDLDDEIRRIWIRTSRLTEETISDLKSYYRKMWIINEEMENLAVNEINRLVNTSRVKRNILNYVSDKRFPWQ